MRGILRAAAYVPYHRLRRAAAAEVLGGRPGRGSRTVASYDEDTTTMAVEAGRSALRDAAATSPTSLLFATCTPAYLDKTNAAAIHAALRLDADVLATDAGGALRSGVGALLTALRSEDPTLVVASDIRTGLPGSDDETGGGDAAAALLTGSGGDGDLVAEHLASASVTREFVDRWRVPGDPRPRQWEERFGETQYRPMAREAVETACKRAGLDLDDVDRLIVSGMHRRAVGKVERDLTRDRAVSTDDLDGHVGTCGTAEPALRLVHALEEADAGEAVLLVHLADGADALLFRRAGGATAERTVAGQVAAGDDSLAYADFLAWRGMLDKEPPRRPEPARYSAPAAARRRDWKYGFVGSEDATSGAVHLPPARVSFRGGGVDDMDPAPMADVTATVATFTVDRLAWSPSPPTVFAVLDFEGGGRFACELTDVDADDVAIGDRVEMTFRVVNEADGLRNYFWKARPVRSEDR